MVRLQILHGILYDSGIFFENGRCTGCDCGGYGSFISGTDAAPHGEFRFEIGIFTNIQPDHIGPARNMRALRGIICDA